jgi:hypothetical protein
MMVFDQPPFTMLCWYVHDDGSAAGRISSQMIDSQELTIFLLSSIAHMRIAPMSLNLKGSNFTIWPLGSSVVIDLMREERIWSEPVGNRHAQFPAVSVNLSGGVIVLLPCVRIK